MENTNRLWRAPGFRRNALLMSVELLWEAEKGECVLIYTALFLDSASLSALSTSLPSDAVRQAYGVYFSDWHLSGFPHSSRESSLAKSICKGLNVAMALWSGSKLFLIFRWQMSVGDNLPLPYNSRVSQRETQIQRTAWPCVSFCTSFIWGRTRMLPRAVAVPPWVLKWEAGGVWSSLGPRWGAAREALPKGCGQPLALLLQLMKTERKKRCQSKDLLLLWIVKLKQSSVWDWFWYSRESSFSLRDTSWTCFGMK